MVPFITRNFSSSILCSIPFQQGNVCCFKSFSTLQSRLILDHSIEPLYGCIDRLEKFLRFLSLELFCRTFLKLFSFNLNPKCSWVSIWLGNYTSVWEMYIWLTGLSRLINNQNHWNFTNSSRSPKIRTQMNNTLDAISIVSTKYRYRYNRNLL